MATVYRYALNLNISITKEENHNPEQDHGYWSRTQDHLSVQESLDLGSMDFLDVMGVLATLHESMVELKSKHSSAVR